MTQIYWLAEMLEEMEKGMMLPPAEQEYANAMLSIVKKYGKLADNDENGIWVGFVPQEENDNYEIGVRCSNCHFYESEKVCKIVARPIEPGGYCRLAAIHSGKVNQKQDDMDDED
jgi:hypothetical protein